MSLYTECVGYIAPFYNLALVLIVVFMFIKLFLTPNKKIYLKPWKMLFYALLIYVFEEILTVLDASGFAINILVYPVLEMAIITCFIYMLLIQKEYTKSKAPSANKDIRKHN